MTFQGDVAGIGLGELLQGLARGERNGVLTLSGPKLSAALGLRRGQLYLLPGPDEDEVLWRERALRAFADDADSQMETARRGVIARASRLETIYQMLDAANLHFRFEPGPLPPPPSFGVKAGQKSIAIEGVEQDYSDEGESPWGAGMAVEYMLLEHARISDEVKTGSGARLAGFDLARALDPARHPPEVRDFLEQCDGASTLQEIADRMGWALSKCRAVVGEHLQVGNVRIAVARELLASAQREMELGRAGRASTRLSGWLMRSAPGNISMADAQLLLGEWERNRMQRALHALEPKMARALLRKLDRIHSDKRAILERWRVLAAAHKQDEICLLHEVSLRLVASNDPDGKTFTDLLRLAHSFHQRGLELRTRTLLRLCANHLPERPQTRIELGKRMLDAGLHNEGSRWLLNTARELLDDNDIDAAMLPIRAVLRVSPEHGEATALLETARVLQAKKKRRRWNMTIGLSAGLVLSLAAVIKFHRYREVERWTSEINARVADPAAALELLDKQFGTQAPEGILELRTRLIQIKEEHEWRLYEDWSAHYKLAEEACRFDALLALRRILALPPAPRIQAVKDPPERTDLLGVLASQLGQKSNELDLPPDASMEEMNEEERFSDLLQEILGVLETENTFPEIGAFQFRVQELHSDILQRRERRAIAREQMLVREREKDQDILLATARAHDQAGDLERSMAAYKRLLDTDQTLGQIPELQKEIARVNAHTEAVKRALQLAEKGDHAGAEKALVGVCQRPVEHLLPFEVESVPSGATVTFGDGRTRTTPFTAKAGIGEHVQLSITLPGYQDQKIEFSKPMDQLVYLHRFPERSWTSSHRIEAAPVPAGDDHIVADRLGRVCRLDHASSVKWQRDLQTLGGIARTPVFLPSKSGWLLVVSEDGLAWLIQASSGEVEGPRAIGSPPIAGPALTRSGVSVQFADGRIAVWNDRLEPIFYQADAMVAGSSPARDALNSSSVAVLRRSAGSGTALVSPWNGWKVAVTESDYRVTSPDGLGFTAELAGDWVYVAWEAPKAMVPNGRLWVSDDRGLRSYMADRDQMVALGH